MKKKIKSNFFNEFKEKVLSGGNYAYVYDKEDGSLTDAVFNVFSDVNDWKVETLDACTASTTTSSTVTIPYYSEETFEDEEESFYIVCDTFEEGEEISPKRKFSDGAKEIYFSMITVPSKRMKNNGVNFPVYFYTPKKRIKEGEKIPSGNYFYHDNILWKKCYSKKMGYDEFFKFVEIHF